MGGAGSKFISFILFPLYSRVFNITDYGAIEVINTFVFLASILLTSGTDWAQSFFFFEYPQPEERKKTLSTLIFYIFLVNVVLTGLIWIFSQQICSILLGTTQFAGILRIASLAIPGMGLYTFNLNVLRLERKPTKYISITIPFVTFQITANIFLVLVLQSGLAGIFWTNVVSYLFFAIIGIIINRSFWKFRFDFSRFKELFRYWSPLFPVGVSAWFLSSADRLFLSSLSTLEATGLYSAGLRIASTVGFFVQIFRTANLPFIFEVAKDADADTIYQKTLSYYFYFTSFLAIVVSLFAKPLLLFLSDKEYLPALNVIPPLAFVYVLSGVTQIISIGAMISKNTKYVGLITAGSALVMGIALLFIIPAYQEMGTAYVVLFANLVYNLLLFWNSQKLHPIPYEIKRILRICAVACFVIVLKFIIPASSLGMEMLYALLILILFMVVTPLFSLLTLSEIKTLQNQIQLFIKNIFGRLKIQK